MNTYLNAGGFYLNVGVLRVNVKEKVVIARRTLFDKAIFKSWVVFYLVASIFDMH